MSRKKNITTPNGMHEAKKTAAPKKKAIVDTSGEKNRKAAIAAAEANIARIERDELDDAVVAPMADDEPDTPDAVLAPMPDAKAAKTRKKVTAKQAKGKPAKTPKAAKPKAAKPDKPKRLGALDAAAQVLASSDKPMRTSEMIAEMAKRNLWKSPGGATPEATLYAAIHREIAKQGTKARFRKIERGLFATNRKGA